MSLEQQLRNAINRSGINMYQLAKQAGLGYATVHDFVKSEKSISLESADKLCKVLNISLHYNED